MGMACARADGDLGRIPTRCYCVLILVLLIRIGSIDWIVIANVVELRDAFRFIPRYPSLYTVKRVFVPASAFRFFARFEPFHRTAGAVRNIYRYYTGIGTFF